MAKSGVDKNDLRSSGVHGAQQPPGQDLLQRHRRRRHPRRSVSEHTTYRRVVPSPGGPARCDPPHAGEPGCCTARSFPPISTCALVPRPASRRPGPADRWAWQALMRARPTGTFPSAAGHSRTPSARAPGRTSPGWSTLTFVAPDGGAGVSAQGGGRQAATVQRLRYTASRRKRRSLCGSKHGLAAGRSWASAGVRGDGRCGRRWWVSLNRIGDAGLA